MLTAHDVQPNTQARMASIRAALLLKNIDADKQSPLFSAKLRFLEQSSLSSGDLLSINGIVDSLSLYYSSVERLKAELSGNPEVYDRIDAVCDRLLAPEHMLYWEHQSQHFQKHLKSSLLNREKTVDQIVGELIAIIESEKRSNQQLALRAGVFGKQAFNPSIGSQQLVAESVVALVNQIRPVPPRINILDPLNQFDISAQLMIEAAGNALQKEDVEHVMFAVGPGHWYWVTISKTGNLAQPFAVEVFDPNCRASSHIYQFLDMALAHIGIDSYLKTPFVNNGLIKPQSDGYSCGYYAASYAHLKVKQIVDAQNERLAAQELPLIAHNCNEQMINALKIHGNRDHYLRDTCLHVMNPEHCPKPLEPSGLPLFQPSFLKRKSVQDKVRESTPLLSTETDISPLLIQHSVWNRRGVQRAICTTIVTEAITLGVFFALTKAALLSFSFPPLALVMVLVAIASPYISNKIEPLIFSPQKAS
jgi:hypothetical protein